MLSTSPSKRSARCGLLPTLLGILLLSLSSCPETSAEDWPWFLGPRHDGSSAETDINLQWKTQPPKLLWKQPTGTGYSAPSIAADRVYVHDLQSENGRAGQERIRCLMASDGATVWEQTFPCDYQDPYGYNNGPRCSPLIVNDRCYTLGPSGLLCCLKTNDGTVAWKKDLGQDFDLPDWFFGMGCSPIYHDGKLIVLVGGQPNSGVVAFDANSGSVLWQRVGRETWNGVETSPGGRQYKWTGDEMVVSYSSPIIATIRGRTHLLCLMRQGLVSLNPDNGSENFRYWFRAKVHESVNAARPVVIGNRILLTAAYRLGAVMLEVQPDGNSVQEVWKNTNLQAHWSTPVHVDGYLYGFSGRHENEGDLRCIRASDGKLMWQTTGFEGNLRDLVRNRATGQLTDRTTGEPVPFPYFGRGSLTRVGNHMIILGERGTLALAGIDPKKYAEVSRLSFSEIDYPAWTAPVLSHGRLYLRSEKWLLCLDVSGNGGGADGVK